MAVLVQILSRFRAGHLRDLRARRAVSAASGDLARRERRQAAFSLERETATNRTHGALRWALLLIVIMADLFRQHLPHQRGRADHRRGRSDANAGVPDLDADADARSDGDSHRDADHHADAAARARYAAARRPSRRRPRRRPTRRWWWPPTAPTHALVIIEPGANQQINGPVQMIGTAQTGSFQYYKIEFKPAGASRRLQLLRAARQPSCQRAAGHVAPSAAAGAYQLRLVTVDVTGNFGQCTVTVNVGG